LPHGPVSSSVFKRTKIRIEAALRIDAERFGDAVTMPPTGRL
jgi:hypothetical protein